MVSLPPSLPVMTAAAPAVGHTRHIMSPSGSRAWPDAGAKCRMRAMARHDSSWKATSHACHGVTRMRRGSTLQKVANSITNSTVGISADDASAAAGFSGASQCT